MKKLLILFLLSALLLAACGGDEVSAPQVSGQLSQAEESEEHSAPDNPNAAITADEVRSIAEALVKNDITLMGIFAGGALGEKSENYADAEGKYYQFSVLDTLAKQTYGDTEAYARMLSYPDYGENNVIDNQGTTQYRYGYINGFASGVKAASVKVVSYDDSQADLEVSAFASKYSLRIYKGEDGEWYLETSLLFAYFEGENQKQLSVPWEESVYLGSRQNAGSLKRLSGDILLLNVFLEDPYSKWEDDEAKAIVEAMKEATLFLERQTMGLDITLSNLHFIYNAEVPGVYSPEFLEHMFERTVYGSVEGYAKEHTKREYDGVALVFHVNKQGNGYTLPYDTAEQDFDRFRTERAIFLYGQNWYGEKTTHSSVEYAQAILRLAGGELLYKNPDAAELALLFPDEVMIKSIFSAVALEDCSLSPITRFLTGLTGYIDTQLIPYTDTQREQNK